MERTALEGYHVDNRYAHDCRRGPIYFVNAEKGVCKLLADDLVLQNFPGWEEGSWTGMAYHLPVTERSAERIDINPYDEQGHTEIIITIQWSDRDDNDPEITLYSTLDDEGNYLHPFRLHRLAWY